MTTVIIKILQVVLALSVLIIIHETGHFTFAKIFGIRVEKFFLFFDAGDAKIFSTKSRWFLRLFPKAASWETEYGIGWLPLGGYCKISGMIDESLDREAMKASPKSWEFRTKPSWQRLLVISGGVLYNFIFAILMYICILDIWGSAYFDNRQNSIWASPLAEELGFRTGDRIIDMDGWEPENFNMLQADLVRRKVSKVRVLRDSDTLTLYMDASRTGDILQTAGLFDIAVPFIVDTIPPTSVNSGLGYLRGDRVTALGGKPVRYVQDTRPILSSLNRDSSITATVIRGADTLSLPMKVDSTGHALIYAKAPQATVRQYSFLQAIPAGFKLTFSTIGGYLKDLRMVATPSTGAYKSVGSFIAIGEVFPSNWDSRQFTYLLALLSIMLGVMNLLPIPGLDGGHIVFILYEMLTGRKPSDKFMEIAQVIGMMLLLALMVFACGNDISRLLR